MKKNWKKTLAALMAFAALWTLAACSAKNTPAPAEDANAPASEENADASNGTRMPADLRDEYGDDFDEDDDEYWYDDDYGYNDDYDDDEDEYAGAEIDQYEFEFDGHSVLVEVAVGDGWSSNVDEDVVLLYDPETSLESEGIASGVLLTEDEYEKEWERCNDLGYECNRGEVGFSATRDGEGLDAFLVDDGVYYMVITDKPEELSEITARFNVLLVMG